MQRRPAISLGEARKVLGKDAEELSDVQLLEVINTLTLLAREHLVLANPNHTQSTVRSSRNKDDNNGTKE